MRTYIQNVCCSNTQPPPLPLKGEDGVRQLSVLDCGYRWVNGSLKSSTHRATAAKRTLSTRRRTARRRTNWPIAVAIGPVFAHLLASIFATEEVKTINHMQHGVAVDAVILGVGALIGVDGTRKVALLT